MGITAKQRALKAARAAARIAQAVNAPDASPVDPVIVTAAELAWRLGEETYAARLQLLRCVRALGCTHARALLADALRIDAQGGEWVVSGMRLRTAGGIFFRLAREALSAELWVAINPASTSGVTAFNA
jgi:hypothetical protein